MGRYKKKELIEAMEIATRDVITYGIALQLVRNAILDEAGEDSVFFGVWYPQVITDLTAVTLMVDAYLASKRTLKPVGKYSGSGVYRDTFNPYEDEED
jgi:hypothetical protein